MRMGRGAPTGRVPSTDQQSERKDRIIMPDGMTPDHLGDFLQRAAREVGNRFTLPEADWAPMGFILGPDGSMTVIELLELADDKDVAAIALGALAVVHDAVAVGLVLSTWQVVSATRDIEPRPSQHPDRFEALVIEVIERARDRIWIARIERRDDGPPALLEFEDAQETGYSRFAEKIAPALAPTS